MNRYESNMKKAKTALVKAFRSLETLNKNGRQYDFVTVPNSADLDQAENLLKAISRKFYQGER